MKYTADFETTTNENDCRVWATGICDIDTNEFYYGNDIDFFFNFAKTHSGATFYFHNLKFDGEFIIYYLFKNNFKHVSDSKKLKSNTFTTLISDKNLFYSIQICFYKDDNTELSCKIFDSLKILPFSVSDIAKAFKFEEIKLNIDYEKDREINHQLTSEEVNYLKNDVLIVAKALKVLFSQSLNRITQGSNGFHDFLNIIGGKKKFRKLFPVQQDDYELRKSYKGGFSYVNEKYKNVEVGKGIVLDVNSLYPFVMKQFSLPFGEPIKFKGKYKKDNLYSLYIQKISCQFKLKENYLPTIQLKNNLSFIPTEYIKECLDEEVILNLTSVDLELFLQHYDVYNLEYLGGFKFKAATGLFNDYIDKWYNIKVQSTIEKNYPMRTLSKLMLNALYGYFALNPTVQGKIPYIDENDIIKYKLDIPNSREPIYIPVATFITSWARWYTITSAQKVYERFLYADTDSLHLLGTNIPECLNISDTEMGAWKIEVKEFTRAKYLRAKSYVEEIEGKLHITCAGMPTSCYDGVTWENFKEGTSYSGKLQMKHVKGGIILNDTDFTIKSFT